MDMYIYIYICEKLFTKTQSLNLAYALQAHFLELAQFGKRALRTYTNNMSEK